MSLIPYFEFIKIPVIFYKTMGQEMLEPAKIPSIYLKILFILGLINYNVNWGLQIILFIMSIKSSSMLDVTAVAPCVGFGFVGNFKQITLHTNKMNIRRILKDLERLYPDTEQLQRDYHLSAYVAPLNPVMKTFAAVCLFNSVYFGFFPLGKSILAMLVYSEKFDYPKGFPMWYPFDTSQNWVVYILVSGLQLWAGAFTGIAVLTADLFLVASVTQLCIQFDYISRKLEEYAPKSREKDHEFLSGIVRLYIKCLKLTESVDEVFSLSLLLNILTSSGTICFVGFEVIAISTEELMRYAMLLVTSLTQIMIICIYGNKLIYASQSVGAAAYSHPWYNADLAYRKMIQLVICRSQKIAAIHAPTFPPISLRTFMKVISMSYQFFAVLQTTYANEKYKGA